MAESTFLEVCVQRRVRGCEPVAQGGPGRRVGCVAAVPDADLPVGRLLDAEDEHTRPVRTVRGARFHVHGRRVVGVTEVRQGDVPADVHRGDRVRPVLV